LVRMKLGVFGGTFNPMHLGHLHLARKVQSLFGLKEIHFVVASTPPHKPLEGLTPLIHRYAMVVLATSSEESFIPSLVELEEPRSPFSLNTMEKLARHTGGTSEDLFFIAGGDSLLEVSGWHQSDKLLDAYNFVFVARPGAKTDPAAAAFPLSVRSRVRDLRGLDVSSLSSRVHEEATAGQPKIFIVDAGAPDISSSKIREMIAAGTRAESFIPEEIFSYIRKLHLYGA
jgi:nicotinate-nucleotide adenylyltransferase